MHFGCTTATTTYHFECKYSHTDRKTSIFKENPCTSWFCHIFFAHILTYVYFNILYFLRSLNLFLLRSFIFFHSPCCLSMLLFKICALSNNLNIPSSALLLLLSVGNYWFTFPCVSRTLIYFFFFANLFHFTLCFLKDDQQMHRKRNMNYLSIYDASK